VWYDIGEIKVGDSIVDKVQQGLTECDYLLIVLSRASTTSQWVQEELSAAKTIEIEKSGVFILPVLIETCTLPPLIASKRYADFRNEYEKGLKELLDVFGRTHIKENKAKRYRTLEKKWSNNILYLDDDKYEMLGYSERLEFDGFSVKYCLTPDEAYDLLKSGYKPDLIVSDLIMRQSSQETAKNSLGRP